MSMWTNHINCEYILFPYEKFSTQRVKCPIADMSALIQVTNGSVPSRNNQLFELMSSQIYDAIWRYSDTSC